jgi:lysophospholipase
VTADAPLRSLPGDGPPGGRAFWLTAADGTRIRAAHWPGGDRGTVFLFPGRGEYAEKYGPAAADLARRGYHTLTVDWRGQGLSDREPANPMIGHVGDFAEYQQDVLALLALARDLFLPQPFQLLSHSMGGTIALRSLHDGLPFRSAVFSAPMWGLLIAPQMRALAYAVTTLARLTGRTRRLTPRTTLASYVTTAPFQNNLLTKDPDMFAWMKAQVTAHPDLALGGPSLGWLSAALSECRTLMRRPPPACPALTVLGSDERIVDTRPVRGYMARWPGGSLEVYPGAEHEIMMETRPKRVQFFDQTARWFETARKP